MISIVIPVYKVEKYLRQCVDSVLAQTYSDWELILVDDGSPDLCPQICDEYAAKDSRIKVIHQENHGVSSARNTGIAKSSGIYLCFIDSDDEVHPDYLRILLNTIEIADADISCIGFCSNANDYNNKIKSIRLFSGLEYCENILYQTDNLCIPSPCGKLFKKRVVPADLFPLKTRYEDLLAFSIFPYCSLKIACSPCILYMYRMHKSSFLHEFNYSRSQVLDVVDFIEGFYCKNAESRNPRLYTAARDRRLSAHFNILRLMTANNFEDKQLEGRCWNVIKKERMSSLVNPKVRLKNKLGILISFLGKSVYKSVAKIIYRN